MLLKIEILREQLQYIVGWMQKNQNPTVVEQNVAVNRFWTKYRKPIVIATSVIVLQLIFGLDPKFCIINILCLFV